MRIIDNVIALRILWLLITPFEKTKAFQLGLIDANGNRIKKAKTSEETNATSMLHRLVWNIKKFINLVPGGSTKIGSMVAAYALVRECIEKDNYLVTQEQLQEAYDSLANIDDTTLLRLIEDVQLLEDVPGNATAGAAVDAPVVKKKPKTVRRFEVSKETLSKFNEGTTKFRRWGAYLNLDEEVDQQIYQFVRDEPSGVFFMNYLGECKGVIYTKTGLKKSYMNSKKPKQIVESYILEYEIEVFDLV